jgi:hypothetical protein
MELIKKKTFDEIKQHYFWHNKFELMQEVVHGCKKCQLL